MSTVEITAWNVKSIPTQTTTTVKADSGILGKILIPTAVASATVKVYDGTAATGTVIVDTITEPASLLSSGPILLDLNVRFNTNLTIVTAGATMPIDVFYL